MFVLNQSWQVPSHLVSHVLRNNSLLDNNKDQSSLVINKNL